MGMLSISLFLLLISAALAMYPNEDNGLDRLADDADDRFNKTAAGAAPDDSGDRPPQFVKRMLPRTIMKPAGNTIALKCKAQGNPAPNITWYKDGETPPSRGFGEFKTVHWGLSMEDAVPADSGNYTCVVCNYLGCISYSYKVTIMGKSKLRMWTYAFKEKLQKGVYKVSESLFLQKKNLIDRRSSA